MTDKIVSMHNIDELEDLIFTFSKTVFCLGLAFDYIDNNRKPGVDFDNNQALQNCLRLIDDCRGNLDMHVSDFLTFEKCLCGGSEFNSEI